MFVYVVDSDQVGHLFQINLFVIFLPGSLLSPPFLTTHMHKSATGLANRYVKIEMG